MQLTTRTQIEATTVGFADFFKSIYQTDFRNQYSTEIDCYESCIYFVTLVITPHMVSTYDHAGLSRRPCFYERLIEQREAKWLNHHNAAELLDWAVELQISHASLMKREQLISAIAAKISPGKRSVLSKPHPLKVFEHLHYLIAEACLGSNVHRQRDKQPFAIAWVDFEGTRRGGGVDPLTSTWPHIHALIFVRPEHQKRFELEVNRIEVCYKGSRPLKGDIAAGHSLEFSHYHRSQGPLSNLISYAKKGADKVPMQFVRKGSRWRKAEFAGANDLFEIFPRSLKAAH